MGGFRGKIWGEGLERRYSKLKRGYFTLKDVILHGKTSLYIKKALFYITILVFFIKRRFHTTLKAEVGLAELALPP